MPTHHVCGACPTPVAWFQRANSHWFSLFPVSSPPHTGLEDVCFERLRAALGVADGLLMLKDGRELAAESIIQRCLVQAEVLAEVSFIPLSWASVHSFCSITGNNVCAGRCLCHRMLYNLLGV